MTVYGKAYVTARVRPLVLVVEFEYLIALATERILSDGGYDVLGPATNVADALALLRAERPDLAVLDVNPGLARATPIALLLRELQNPYVLASAHADDELAYDPLLSGVINVGKPTVATTLLAALSRLL